jgi:hypothetical protein
MRSNLIFLFPVLALTGCVTGPSLQSRMAAYIGDNAQSLVQNLGVPDKQITVNGVQYLAYVRRYQEIEPGYLAFGGYGPYGGPFYGSPYAGGFYGAGFPSQVNEFSCETTFLLKDDRVVSFSLRGNYCEG